MFRSKTWVDSNNTEYAFMICWGRLTRDPKVKCVNKTQVEFGMAYYKHTFMNCVHWGEDEITDLMSSLEKGDSVLCLGTWSRKQYTNKKGEIKDWSELDCEFVVPLSAVSMLLDLIASPSIRKLLDSDSADRFESAEDFEEEDSTESEDDYEYYNTDDDEGYESGYDDDYNYGGSSYL